MKQLILTIVVAALVASGVTFLLPQQAEGPAPAATRESAYDRVMRTGVLRCGYFLYPRFFDINPNTGEKSGLIFDLMSLIAEDLSLKVEWVKEVPLSEFAAALESGRIDAMCGPLGIIPSRLRASLFTRPFSYMPIYPVVRANDTRFDASLSALNSPEHTISAIEGQATGILARRIFPSAKLTEIIDMSGITGALNEVVTGKADVVFMDRPTFNDFISKNPGSLKIAGQDLLGVYATGMALPLGEHSLKALIDGAISYQIDSQVFASLVKKYQLGDGMLPLANGYAERAE